MRLAAILAALGAAGLLWAQGQAALDLQRARLIADRGDWGSPVPVPQLADGKLDTTWTSGEMDLRVSPADLLLVFPEPTLVGALELDTVVLKNALRVTDFEVYARAGQGWHLAGKVTGATATTQRVSLKPLRTSQLRIRLRDNAREGHGWAVVAEVRVYPPAATAAEVKPKPEAVPGETLGERMFVATALGELPSFPRAKYDPRRGYGYYVRSFLDTLLQKGTDVYGPTKSPMLVSLLLLDGKQHPQSVIPSMPGQRIGDRALFGGNLQHDLPLLLAMQGFSRQARQPRYDAAARAYLQFFLTNCTKTATGLWPWGEHGHWNFFTETYGHTYHEYLGAPPAEFLEAAWALNPQAVRGEADGMLNHVRDFATYQFCRHAEIDKPLTDPRQADRKGLDFPRHGAMFARQWAYVYGKTGDAKYLGYVDGMLKHFELTRQQDGTLPTLSELSDRSALGPGWGNNLSVGVSLLEAAEWLGETPTAAHTRQLGRDLLDTLAAATPKTPPAPVFAMAYGSSEFGGGEALLRCQAYRLTGDQRHLEAAKAFAEVYAPVAKLPTEGHIRALVYGVMVNLYLDLAELDKDAKWLPLAEKYARFGIEDLYHEGLFRGASNLLYYDSELYVSTLVYGLVRLQGRLDGAQALPPLYFHR